MAALGSYVGCHGWRWVNYQAVTEDLKSEHIARMVATVERLMGMKPLGW